MMTQWTKTNDTADTAKAATEMQDLTLRTTKVLSQLHVRALKKASQKRSHRSPLER